MKIYKFYADGKWFDPSSGEYIDSCNPATEEVFGPVLAVIPFDTEEEAIAIANDSKYGLAAGVWTADTNRAIRVADKIKAGTVYINNYFNSAPQSPVGGYKQSGFGREKGIEGMLNYVQTKNVGIRID